MNRNISHIFFEKFGNVQHINPVSFVFCDYTDIESEKFIMRCIVNSFLNSFCSLNFLKAGSIFRPETSKVLSIDSEFDHVWIVFLDRVVNVWKFVVESLYKISGIKEGFFEMFTWILTGHRNLVAQEISPSSIAGSLSIEMN